MSEVKITIHDNASISVEGPVAFKDQRGNDLDMKGKNKVFLCRCGMSKNKPFCDGAHKEGFEHTVELDVK